MSDDEGSGDDNRTSSENPVPQYKIISTDIQKELVEKAIKLIYRVHQAKKLDKDLQFTIHKELNS
jgi:chemotaxis methyl-accepting protein methylase